MDILYRVIVLFFAIFIARYVYQEKNVWNQAGAVVVLVLFVLRLLMIK